MRHFRLAPYLVTVAAISASIAVPLAPRSGFCSNAPTTVAGTTLVGATLNGRSNPVLRSSINNVKWCVPNTQTFITLRLTATLSPVALKALLFTAWESIHRHYQDSGDGLLPGGGFTVQSNNLVFELMNSNNHQCTWGILRAALWAISNFMYVQDEWGEVAFDVFDGGNQVASGTIAI